MDGPAVSAARRLAIAQINATDEGGGAAAVTDGLALALAGLGHDVWTIVGRAHRDRERLLTFDDDDRLAYRAVGYMSAQRRLRRLAGRHPNRGFGLASRLIRLASHPRAMRCQWRGVEDFEFPASHRLFERTGLTPDVVHAHNLHGGYFDLRALAPISARVPTIVTLHDMWMLTGHCAHALQCERWQAGCGQCPDLKREPAIRRDATTINWRRKRDVYASSRLHLGAPSRWMRDRIERSMLAPSAADVRVIPNGVDTAVFCRADRAQVRAALDLPIDRDIVLLTTGSRGSMWKDDRTLHRATAALAGRRTAPLFVAVGRESAVRGDVDARVVPFVDDPAVMARYYQAADLYLHAARADTFPLTVLEAMACGTPVVATAVGGVPEQIDERSGVLVAAGDAAAMAEATAALLDDPSRRARLGNCAAQLVSERFTLAQHAGAYLDWYRELVERAR